MKKQLTLCCAIFLAGCSSAPSEGDIEDFMQAKFSSCKNIMVKDVAKKNGYEENDYYVVDFSYNLKVKEPKILSDKKQQFIEEMEQKTKASASMKEIAQIVSDLEHEIQKLDWAGYPKTNDFDKLYAHLPVEERTSLLHAAQEEYTRNPPAELQRKRQELKIQKEALDVQREIFPRTQIVGNVWSVVENVYQEGCSPSAKRFMRPLLSAPREAANAYNDQTRWFDEYDIQMTAKIPMHKTENGWRPVSER